MNRHLLVKELERKCECFFDHASQELWKCIFCEARDWIGLLVFRLQEIGCIECDVKIKELLK